ncbi:MAG TPA: sugar transferase [Armatimonadota bacterium]|jgi:O-antigen biosynthesis protein WbqP
MTSLTRDTETRPAARRASCPYDLAKRALDLVLAAVGLLILCPLCAAIALAIWRDDPGPVIFRQRRIGLHGREFMMLKFRSMVMNAPNVSTEAMKAMGTSFYTRIGAFLRRSSLDEIPQLWNVLRGDMSLVGPRPALYTQGDLIAMRKRSGVHDVRPGITGLAQVEGRDDLGLEAKVENDRRYVANRSIWLDIWVIWRTVAAVASARGNY